MKAAVEISPALIHADMSWNKRNSTNETNVIPFLKPCCWLLAISHGQSQQKIDLFWINYSIWTQPVDGCAVIQVDGCFSIQGRFPWLSVSYILIPGVPRIFMDLWISNHQFYITCKLGYFPHPGWRKMSSTKMDQKRFGWWFQIFFMFIPSDPIWLIFVR